MTGRLTIKGNKYYMVLNTKEGERKYKQKWLRTGLDIEGNLEKAEFMLWQTIRKYEITRFIGSDVELIEFTQQWLRVKRLEVEETTYESYRVIVNAQYGMDKYFSVRSYHSNQ